MNDLWPAWKVALVLGVTTFIGLMVIGLASGGLDSSSPYKLGESLGQRWGWIVFVVPLVGYIVQKWRIDRHDNTLQ